MFQIPVNIIAHKLRVQGGQNAELKIYSNWPNKQLAKMINFLITTLFNAEKNFIEIITALLHFNRADAPQGIKIISYNCQLIFRVVVSW